MNQLFYSAIDTLGEFSIFFWNIIKSGRRLFYRWGLFLKQCEFIGVSSVGIITVAALFMGGVLGYQLYVSFHLFGAESLLGGTVGVSLFRELAPVMGAIMVTGRAGAAMAAELASMRVSEQIDALEVMAVDPIEFLVLPRVLGGLLMMPLLSVYFGVIGSLAGYGVSVGIMGLDGSVFWEQYRRFVDPIDLTHCVVKGAFFGLVLTWVACFCGFRAQGGARSVGFATRATVVATCLSILLFDYILTSILPFGFAHLKI
ncbi:MAG: MlaE family lipid ABC transporter permease subunit [Bdellovibrionales bacterium]|nr:MlaE family lipid ABC transporter permease subunit [Bdellovibrionales bacterium]